MSQFHFDPATYLDLMREEVPAYERLQDAVAEASAGVAVEVTTVLDLGTGTGETLAAVLARHGGRGRSGWTRTPACSTRRADASPGSRSTWSWPT